MQLGTRPEGATDVVVCNVKRPHALVLGGFCRGESGNLGRWLQNPLGASRHYRCVQHTLWLRPSSPNPGTLRCSP